MLRVLASLFVLLAVLTPVRAAEVATGHARSDLVLAREAAAPGGTALIAFRQQLETGWHVYWKNSGTTGQPLSLTWSAPEGYAVGDIRFPTPKAKATGPIVDYILDGAPVFFIPVEIPATARPGERVRVSADAYWLICDDVCVPEEATLSLDIPIAEDVGAEKAFVAAARRTHPTPLPGEATFAAEPDLLVLRIASETLDGADICFFPEAEGLVRPAAAQTDVRRDGVAALGMAPDFNYDPDGLERLIGVLRVERNGRAVGYEIDATRADLDPRLAAALADRLAGRADGGPSSGSSSEPVSLTGWLLAVGAALIGGLVLNLMPCVFPIVFLKAAGVADAAARGEAGEVRAHALLYAGGVLSSFLALAALLYGFRAAGADIGWGFHLQSPAVIGVLTVIMTLVGLHLAGLFETGAGLQRAGGALLGTMGGKGGAFLTGVLAVALAAPCVGPFVGGALGLAVAQPGFGGLLVFAGLGLGLAGPYLLLAAAPQAALVLPKPGAWMVRVRQALAFPVFGTAVWLLWVASVQAGEIAVLYIGGAALAAGFAAWALSIAPSGGVPRRAAQALAAVAALAGVFALTLPTPAPQAYAGAAPAGGRLQSVAYTEDAVETLRAYGRPVFVEFTAAWCVTCQFNKQTVLKRPAVEAAFRAADAAYVVGDWTNRDPAITAALEAQGRSGVPLYLYYAPGAAEPDILPQTLTVDLVASLFETGSADIALKTTP
ncbi:MAG: thioredoxin family protein [Pseudomonadota bacterium]